MEVQLHSVIDLVVEMAWSHSIEWVSGHYCFVLFSERRHYVVLVVDSLSIAVVVVVAVVAFHSSDVVAWECFDCSHDSSDRMAVHSFSSSGYCHENSSHFHSHSHSRIGCHCRSCEFDSDKNIHCPPQHHHDDDDDDYHHHRTSSVVVLWLMPLWWLAAAVVVAALNGNSDCSSLLSTRIVWISRDVRGSNGNSVIHTSLMRDRVVNVNRSINRLAYLLTKR